MPKLIPVPSPISGIPSIRHTGKNIRSLRFDLAKFGISKIIISNYLWRSPKFSCPQGDGKNDSDEECYRLGSKCQKITFRATKVLVLRCSIRYCSRSSHRNLSVQKNLPILLDIKTVNSDEFSVESLFLSLLLA